MIITERKVKRFHRSLHMHNLEPIFIGGVNRSGTSLMRQIIGSHSDIAIPPSEFHFFKYLKGQIEEPLEKKTFLELIEIINQWPKVSSWKLDKAFLLDFSATLDPSYRSLFSLFMEAYKRKCRKKRWGEKTTKNEFHLHFINEWYPDFKFIHMIRNPIDVFASQSWYNGQKQSIDVRNWANSWNKSTDIALANRSRNNYIVVSYEKLVASPEREIEELCKALGLEFQKKRMLEMRDFENKNNSSFNNQLNQDGTIQLNKTNRAELLSDEEKEIIGKMCWKNAKFFGYENSLALKKRFWFF